ncbi:MAG: tyrosine-type recombinase/integrase [Burkholderiaceae bacterium]|nr:tyrosine-type recombinase/integrase [Burkholderiaceae bacterium]
MQLKEALENFLTFCEEEKNLSPHSIRAYRADLKNFSKVVGENSDIAQLSAAWIEKSAQLWLKDPGLKKASVKRRVACIKSMVRWLFRRRHIKSNPLESLDLEIKLPKRLPRNLQTNEIKSLMGRDPETTPSSFSKPAQRLTPRQQWNYLTARLAIEVMTLTGVRVGELVRIKRPLIDLTFQQIRILGKGNRERQVSFPDSLTIERLEKYHRQMLLRFGQGDHDVLFVNGLGRPANEQYIRRIVRQYAKFSELHRHVTPHMLRHTAATQLLEAGVDMRYVQRILGHASITTTEIYTYVADHALRLEVSRANVRRRLEMN